MIKVPVTWQMIQNAKLKAREMGRLHNSITGGDGNLSGFIGEFVAAQVLHGVVSNTYDYDLKVGHELYDVKTKRCTSPPRPHYECSVADFNTKQQCHKYCFVRIMITNNVIGPAWYLGCMDKREYFKKAKLLKKGQVDPSNNFVVKADCYNLPIRELD